MAEDPYLFVSLVQVLYIHQPSLSLAEASMNKNEEKPNYTFHFFIIDILFQNLSGTCFNQPDLP